MTSTVQSPSGTGAEKKNVSTVSSWSSTYHCRPSGAVTRIARSLDGSNRCQDRYAAKLSVVLLQNVTWKLELLPAPTLPFMFRSALHSAAPEDPRSVPT